MECAFGGKGARSTEATAVARKEAWAAPHKTAYMTDPEFAEAGTGANGYGIPMKKNTLWNTHWLGWRHWACPNAVVQLECHAALPANKLLYRITEGEWD